MTDKAVESTTIDGSVQECVDVLLDFERYPEWAADMAETAIVERDDQGRGKVVRYRAGAFGRTTGYTLAYDHSALPTEIRWSLVDGDIMSRCDGIYRLESDSADGPTTVTYELEIDLAVPLPGFVKRRAEVRIVTTAVRELKRRVEGG